MAPRPARADPKAVAARLRRAALGYPEAYPDNPWGEWVAKVRGKIFLFMHLDGGRELALSVKLPQTGLLALSLPFAEPTGYGLGKSGWVSAHFARGAKVPVPMLLEWLDESYRAVAPAKLVKTLEAPAPAPRTARGPRASGRDRRPASG